MIIMTSPNYSVAGGDRPVIYSIAPKHSRTNPETMLPALLRAVHDLHGFES